VSVVDEPHSILRLNGNTLAGSFVTIEAAKSTPLNERFKGFVRSGEYDLARTAP